MFDSPNINTKKKWISVFFIGTYLIPLTWLFLEQVVLKSFSKGVWLDLLVLTFLFGLPLLALWLSVIEYPDFDKGRRPFRYSEPVQKLIFCLLGQGILLCALCILSPILFLFGLFPFPEPFALGVALIVGIVGCPAMIFSAGVLLKQIREKRRAKECACF